MAILDLQGGVPDPDPVTGPALVGAQVAGGSRAGRVGSLGVVALTAAAPWTRSHPEVALIVFWRDAGLRVTREPEAGTLLVVRALRTVLLRPVAFAATPATFVLRDGI